MGEFKIPKHKVAAEVQLVGCGRRAVELFLADSSASHAGPEQVADLLRGESPFLPAFEPAAERMLFLNKAQLVAVAVAPAAGADPTLEANIPTAHEVELELADGQALSGVVAYVRPPDRSRLVDLLNEPELFLRLVTPERVLYVNKRHLALVSQKDDHG